MTDRDIWTNSEWVARRARYNHYQKWFKGTYLDETVEKRDRKTGDLQKRYPLRLNLPGLACEVHRDLARGIPYQDDPLVVRVSIARGEQRELVESLESILNEGIWRPSHGGPVQQEALLAMNVYGGTVLKMAWEPWEWDLPYKLAIRLIKNPGHIHPTWDWLNPWKLLECYIGYEISPKAAVSKYGVKVDDPHRPVLYMEHWTQKEWVVRVNDQIPTMKWGDQSWKLQGDNLWDFVPVFYVPHERTEDGLFGDSAIPAQEGITKELNARTTDIADIVRAMRPGLYVGHDLDGSLSVRKAVIDGNTVARIIDIGHKRPAPNSGTPGMDPLGVPDAPEALLNFPSTLLNFWMMMSRISPATFGLDDTSSGRITGPAIAQRMWTSMAHSVTERINFTECKTIVDRALIVALARKRNALGKLGIQVPEFPEGLSSQLELSQRWPPMIPLERQDRHKELIDRLREGGISIEEYLAELGVEDVEEQKRLILEWQMALAEIEAAAKPQPEERPQNERRDQGQDT